MSDRPIGAAAALLPARVGYEVIIVDPVSGLPVGTTAGGAAKGDLTTVAGTATSVNTGVPDAGSQRVVLAMNASGTATGFPGPTSLPVAGYSAANGNQYTLAMVDSGVIQTRSNDPYPARAATGTAAVVLGASSGNVANAIASATLANAAGVTTYITGFQVTAAGATAGLPVVVTVAGLLGGTQSFIFTFPAGALVPAQPLTVAFPMPVPASAANVAIVVSCPAGGAGNTNAAVSVQGFRY